MILKTEDLQKQELTQEQINYVMAAVGNVTKTHIARPQKLKYLGFGFYKDSKAKEWKCRPHQESVKKLKVRLKELTSRKMPGTVTSKIGKITKCREGR